MKWDGNQIILFLNIYEKYEILWNIKLKEHMNKLRRDNAFEKLLKELEESGFQNIDITVLKTKIKTIKTVYRQEVNKILKSKKSGSGTDDLYKPKLMWFARADSFLRNMVISRETTNNMEATQQETAESDAEETIPPESPSTPQSLKRIEPSSISQPPKCNKRSRNVNSASRVDKAIDSLKEIVEKNENKPDDQYDAYAKHISSQLRELSQRSFIILQSEIQNLITRERLAHLPSANQVFHSNEQNLRSDYSQLNQQQMQHQNDRRSSTSNSYYSDIEQLQMQQQVVNRPSRPSTSYSDYSDIVQQAKEQAFISDEDYDGDYTDL